MDGARIDAVLARASSELLAPGVAAIVTSAERVEYRGAHGCRDVETKAPMKPDAIFRVASFTKMVVAIAALRLVDEGQLDLDTPVGDIIPAFDELQVLTGMKNDTPQLRAPRRRATVRNLMTHTSGLTYDTFSEDLTRFCATTGTPMPGTGLKACFKAPMVFDPGSAWAYGMSTDWTGQVLEAITGERLDVHLRRTLFDPLGLDDVTFSPSGAQRQRLVPVHTRTAAGDFQRLDFEFPDPPEFYSGGHGLYASADGFARLQQVLLNGGAVGDFRVLREQTVAMMTSSQLGSITIPPLRSTRADFSYDLVLSPHAGWGLDIMVTVEGDPGMRLTGSVGWCGTFNTFYWIDPRSGLAAALYLQYLPFFDPGALALARDFERAVYASR